MNDSEANPEASGGDGRPVNSDVADDSEDERNGNGGSLHFDSDSDVLDLLALAAGAHDSSGQGGAGAGGTSQRAANDGTSTTMPASSSDEYRDINDGDAADPSPTERSEMGQWDDLSDEMRDAARLVSYTQELWDESDGEAGTGSSPAPPSNQALVDDFLHWHETWKSHDKVLNQLESWGMDPSCYKGVRALRTPLKFICDNLDYEERGDDTPSRLADEVNGANDSGNKKTARSNDGDAPSSSMSLEELSGVLFRPGMKFRGRIFIPGMGNHNHGASFGNEGGDSDIEVNDDSNVRSVIEEPSTSQRSPSSRTNVQDSGDTYELTVREQGEDAMGNSFILATHQAYYDEQVRTKMQSALFVDLLTENRGSTAHDNR